MKDLEIYCGESMAYSINRCVYRTCIICPMDREHHTTDFWRVYTCITYLRFFFLPWILFLGRCSFSKHWWRAVLSVWMKCFWQIRGHAGACPWVNVDWGTAAVIAGSTESAAKPIEDSVIRPTILRSNVMRMIFTVPHQGQIRRQ